MFLCQPCGGLRSCVFQQPPLLMFFLCLVTLAVTFLSLGAYVKTHPVRNADVTQDWDSLLQALGLLQFCPQGNATGRVTPLLLAGSPLNVSGLHPGGLASTSVLVGLSLRPWDPVTNTSGLRLSVSSAQLGLRGEGTGADLFVTLSPVRSAGGCGDTDCSTKYCVTVTAPVSLLPQARSPLQCPQSMPSAPPPPDLYVAQRYPGHPSHCYTATYNRDPEMLSMISQVRSIQCCIHCQ
ncbi:hypothetical protein FKM82_021347 [Ascaphus truei]